MTHRSVADAGPLGVVIPVKEIDGPSFTALKSLAASAPNLSFVAVGKVTIDETTPHNLKIVDIDCGIYQAMNIGVAESRAKYLLFMGIDDRLIWENVEKVLDQLRHVASPSLVVLPFMVGSRLVSQKVVPGERRSFHHQGVLFEREKILHLKGYSTQYRLHSDLDLMFRIQSLGSTGVINCPLVIFSTTGVTTSGRLAEVSIAEFWKIYGANGISRLSVQLAASMALAAWYGVRYRLRKLRDSDRRK